MLMRGPSTGFIGVCGTVADDYLPDAIRSIIHTVSFDVGAAPLLSHVALTANLLMALRDDMHIGSIPSHHICPLPSHPHPSLGPPINQSLTIALTITPSITNPEHEPYPCIPSHNEDPNKCPFDSRQCVFQVWVYGRAG